MAESVKVRKHGEVAELLLSRPQAFNAFDLDMLEGLSRHLMALAVDDDVRGLVICGEGKAFCAGADLKWVSSRPRGLPGTLHELAAIFHQAIVEIRRMRIPVIAAVNGIAAGGGFSMALACDFRVMARSAALRQAYGAVGLCIDGGGTYALPRLVGLARALEIAAFDEPIPADQALAWGLATKVVDDGRALEEALSMARGLAKTPLNSFRWAKQLFTDSYSTPLEAHLERERVGLCHCAAHADGREGVGAFVEKRKPTFGAR